MPDSHRPASVLRKRILRLLPYVAAFTFVTLILQRYSLSDIQAEMTKGNSLALLPFAAGVVFINLFVVAAADSLVIRGLLEEPLYLDVVRGKAASVLLEMVNYAVGKGAYGAWIARKYGAGVGGSSGIMLYIVASELCSMAAFGAAGILIGQPDIPEEVLTTFGTITGVLLLFIVTGPLNHLADRVVLFRPWTRLGIGRGLAQILIRMLQHTGGILATWAAANAFGVPLPLSAVVAYVPVIAIVGALPINVAGFGAVQGAWLLLEPWAPGEQLLAFSLLWGLALGLMVVLRGLLFVRGVVRELREGSTQNVSI